MKRVFVLLLLEQDRFFPERKGMRVGKLEILPIVFQKHFNRLLFNVSVSVTSVPEPGRNVLMVMVLPGAGN